MRQLMHGRCSRADAADFSRAAAWLLPVALPRTWPSLSTNTLGLPLLATGAGTGLRSRMAAGKEGPTASVMGSWRVAGIAQRSRSHGRRRQVWVRAPAAGPRQGQHECSPRGGGRMGYPTLAYDRVPQRAAAGLHPRGACGGVAQVVRQQRVGKRALGLGSIALARLMPVFQHPSGLPDNHWLHQPGRAGKMPRLHAGRLHPGLRCAIS